MTTILRTVFAVALTLSTGCTTSSLSPTTAGEAAARPPPPASAFTTAPLRNRVTVWLRAPVAEVWALVGRLERLPEYSAGLQKVEVTRGAAGERAGFVCTFKPSPGSSEAVSHRERFRWYEEGRGFASLAEEPNSFGLTASLARVTVEPDASGTRLIWEQYFDAAELEPNKAEFDRALGDIAQRLVERFGGRVTERFVEPPG